MLFDTHAHLHFPEFAEDLPGVLERARAAGVGWMLTIGTSAEGSRAAVALAEREPDLYAAVGIHQNRGIRQGCDHVGDQSIDRLRGLRYRPGGLATGAATAPPV